MMRKSNEVSSRKARLQLFTKKDKICLMKAVQKTPVLWKPDHPKHLDAYTASKAWDVIGKQLDKDARKCKAAWISLRESYRYHIKKCRKSDGKGAVSLDPKDIKWEFAPYMAFMLYTPPQTRSINEDCSPVIESVTSSPEKGEDESKVLRHASPTSPPTKADESDTEILDSMKAEFEEYCLPPESGSEPICEDSLPSSSCSRKRQRSVENETDTLIGELLQRQNALLAKHREVPVGTQRDLQNYDVFLFWDSIMKDMSPAAVREAKFAMTALLNDISKKDIENNNTIKK
ncbi:uncharacterized protein LOC115623070 [Scaptodrosophila lebanonensis]|uniref:Uncharacterized protein LOC115623070 n=1 Tax=Drosophila lebanonensis TaxID=7225 RepID=A0A6J2TAR2_DROLE|nr:uncharacterized protein LOC115623070 [Scaptodrosophila lebanonensis]